MVTSSALTSAGVKASGSIISIGEAALDAILGYAVVFTGLVLLMCVIVIVGKVMTKKSAAKTAAPTAAAAPAPAGEAAKAPGSAGEIKLNDVPEREAAMLMAIVADKMGKPLNEIRFKSIKEVK